MIEKIQATIDRIRPFLQRDGGDIELVEFVDADKLVKVRLQGACHGCPGAIMTLKMGVERTLQEEVDQALKVVAV